MLWPYSGNLGTSTVNEGDCLILLSQMYSDIRQIFSDPGNILDTNVFYPYINTGAFGEAMLGQALQAMPVLWLTGNIVLAYNLLTLFSFALSGWCMYLLVKDITGSRAGGLLAGVVYGFSSYRIGHLSQLNLLSTQWIPLCFLFLRRMALRDMEMRSLKEALRRDWWLVGGFAFFVALTALSSIYYLFYPVPLYAVFLVMLYALRKKLPSPVLFLKLIISVVAVSLIMLPVIIPYLGVASELSAERTLTEVERFSANYRFYLGVPDDNLFWGRELKSLSGTGGERSLFPGAVGLLFGVIALFGPLAARLLRGIRAEGYGKTRLWLPERWGWLAVGIFALLMSFGLALKAWGISIPMPYGLFYEFFPGWNGLRAAVRYGIFVTFAVAVLSGFGVAYVLKLFAGNGADTSFATRNIKQYPQMFLKRGYWLVPLILFAAFWEYRSNISYINPSVLTNPPQVYRWLGEAGNEGPVLELPLPADPRNGFSIRSYYSTFNWQPLVSGANGYVPPVYSDLYTLTSTNFPNKDALAILQGMGVRWVVYHLKDENLPLPSDEWPKIEARLKNTPQLKLVRDFPQDNIKVFELTPDPWMIKLAQSLPANEPVISSDYRRTAPTVIELTQTIFRRYGHPLYGIDRSGYRFLNPPPSGKPVDYGLFSANEDPTPYGFKASDETWSGYGLKLYKRKEATAVAYDVARDSKLQEFSTIKGAMELEAGKNEVKFNGKGVGGGRDLSASKGYLRLMIGALKAQSVKYSVAGAAPQTLEIPEGLSEWRSPSLTPGEKFRIEPANGETLLLSRVEWLAATETVAGISAVAGNPAIMSASNRQEGQRFISTFDILTPAVSATDPGKYTLTLDVYRRPWGTHPSGHFGNWSIALTGGKTAHRVEYTFDPLTKETTVTVDGNRVDVGADVIRPGEGDWAVFIALWRSNPQKPGNDTQVGVARLYEFSIAEGKIREVTILPDRPLFFKPSLN
jgi:hypothetical protein